MKKTVYLNDFINEFHAIRPDNFSDEGLKALFSFFEEFEDDIELDVIAICCDYSEASMQEIIDSFNIDIDYERNIYMQVMDFLDKNTCVIGDTSFGTIVFQNF
jgi:hypothetical protein